MIEDAIHKKIDIPIYGGYLNVHVTKVFERTLKEVNYDGDLECDACCVYNTDGTRFYDLIFKHGRIQHGIITHECFHLVHRIMKSVNKEFDVNNDEPEAYLIQFLADEIYRFMRDNKIKIRT